MTLATELEILSGQRNAFGDAADIALARQLAHTKLIMLQEKPSRRRDASGPVFVHVTAITPAGKRRLLELQRQQ